MTDLAPLGDTHRVLDWEELPASVREIPESLDLLEDGILMQHQAEYLAQRKDLVLAVVEKGRRTGITFAEGLDSPLIAALPKSAGGDNVYYIGDTKEKGLEFIGYCAKMARFMTDAMGHAVSGIEEFLFEDHEKGKDTKFITAYRIRFASGHQICALSSRPANIRGLQGIVIIDEAAFHADVNGVLEAATALLIWGGRIRVISTHNGTKNAFNQLVRDVRDGKYGDRTEARVFRITFDDAVANGLYERVCLINGWTPTPEDKKKWYARVRNAYGPRKAAMREELDAIPRDGGGLSIPGVWIEAVMREERPVLRIAVDDDFVQRPELERKLWADGWCKKYLDPLLDELPPNLRHIFGYDFARHRHFSVIMPATILPNMTRQVPFIIEMHKVPTRQQEQILWHLLSGLPRFSVGAIDATGPGQTIAEYTADKFGHDRIHQVDLSRAWYKEWMPPFVNSFEDGTICLPRDASTADDIRAIEEIDGIPMVPRIEKRDLKDPDMLRHGDAAIAAALMWYASLQMYVDYDYIPVRKGKEREHDRPINTTGGFRRSKGLF